MSGKRHLFRFSVGANWIEKQRCDFSTARRDGDAHADEHEAPVRCDYYNDIVRRWEFLGSFIGKRKFVTPAGEMMRINSIFSRIYKEGGEE